MNFQGSIEEAVPVAADEVDAVSRTLADAALRDEPALLDAIEARRVQVGLSLAELDRLSGLTFGHSSKVLSPGRVKCPTMRTFQAMLDSLALSIVLVVDGAKLSQISPSWRHRDESHVRVRPLSPITVARARPRVLAELSRAASRPKWAGVDARTFIKTMAREEIA